MKEIEHIKFGTSILKVRTLKKGDENLLLNFSNMIGNETKRLFSPYHWSTEKQLPEYILAITKTVNKEDASFLAINESNTPVALLNLWGISREVISKGKALKIPTLGICVADEYQNKGIEKEGVKFLQKIAKSLGAEAIELTTVVDNNKAIKLYLNCEFKDIGMLNIPLGIDPSTTDESELKKATWRRERHMVYIINKELQTEIIYHLSQKQVKFNGRK